MVDEDAGGHRRDGEAEVHRPEEHPECADLLLRRQVGHGGRAHRAEQLRRQPDTEGGRADRGHRLREPSATSATAVPRNPTSMVRRRPIRSLTSLQQLRPDVADADRRDHGAGRRQREPAVLGQVEHQERPGQAAGPAPKCVAAGAHTSLGSAAPAGKPGLTTDHRAMGEYAANVVVMSLTLGCSVHREKRLVPIITIAVGYSTGGG